MFAAAAAQQFLSTPSARRATHQPDGSRWRDVISIHALREEGDPRLSPNAGSRWKFLSTPSARRATRVGYSVTGTAADFYPRPPRGGRQPPSISTAATGAISIHALREEGDTALVTDKFYKFLFLSTPSARRATFLPSRAARAWAISIHALREEGDSPGR